MQLDGMKGRSLMHRLAVIVGLSLVVCLAAGCAASPPSRFYVLKAAKTVSAAPVRVSVAVGPVSVPAQVDRPQIVVITGANQVRPDEFNRWAAPLQNNISLVVAENLAALLGTPHVTVLGANADYRAAIEVQTFESALGQAAILDALWTVRRSNDGKTEIGRTTVREALSENSYDAVAAAHSAALASVSRDIAEAVRRLELSRQ